MFSMQGLGSSGCFQPAPWEAQQSGGEWGMLVNTSKLVAESRCYNPDPLVWSLGHANEAKIVVEGGNDSTGRYWVPNLCPHWGILYKNWLKDPSTEEHDKGCVAPQGDGGVLIPYKGYIEVNFTIPDLPQYNKDVLFLVVSNNKYW